MASALESPWRQRWLKAVYRGDCLEIKDLLKKDKRLVTIYPRSGSCKDASDFAARFDGWRGCSALHVAVKRGWPFLVNLIVNLFHEELQPSNIPVKKSGREIRVKSAGTDDADAGQRNLSPGAERRAPTNLLSLSMLEELLLAFDSDYHLDAVALAVVYKNLLIVRILASAFAKCTNCPYRARFPNLPSRDLAPDRWVTGFENNQAAVAESVEDLKAQVREITDELRHHEQVTDSWYPHYKEDPAYNFLPQELFFSHHWIVDRCRFPHGWPEIIRWLAAILEKLLVHPHGSALKEYMFSLKDGRGKTLAHVLAAEQVHPEVWEAISQWDEDDRRYFISVHDGAGRTVAHEFIARVKGTRWYDDPSLLVLRGADGADDHSLLVLLGADGTPGYDDRSLLVLRGSEGEELTRKCTWLNSEFEYFDVHALCTRNGYSGHNYRSIFAGTIIYESTAVQYAALHNCPAVFSTVNGRPITPDWNNLCRVRLSTKASSLLGIPKAVGSDGQFIPEVWVSVFHLAALAGSDLVFKSFLTVDEAFDGARMKNTSTAAYEDNMRYGMFSVLFIASRAGDPAMIQALLASRKFDALTTTLRRDTALHFAANADYSGPVLQPTLLDLVNVSHRPGMTRPHGFRFQVEKEELKREEFIRAADSKRKGCINLLLQAGIDIWQRNREGNIADPGDNASPDFCSWWYEKLAKETQDMKAGLNSAANAISVTAALVATASFVGPLQPPLNYESRYEGQPKMLQVDFPSVRIFIVCDTLALYFALVAILFSLMPLLPLPQESVLDELSHVRKIVRAAVAFLILSVVSFLISFAAASIAVTPNDNLWNSGGLTISSVAIGGVFSLYLMYLFLLRLARLTFHRNIWLRRNYKGMTMM